MPSGHTSAVILPSGSRSRAAMLSASGLDIQIQPAELDETSVKNACRDQGKSVDFVAAQLAREKAAAISAANEDVYVIGADQMLDCDGQWFDKPPDLEAAAESLIKLRGRSHDLVTSASIVRNGEEVWRLTDRATLHMRDFSDRFLDQYLSDVGELALTSVGAYQLEGRGAQLFERIEGDYFTILGLPLLPLLSYLREQELIPS